MPSDFVTEILYLDRHPIVPIEITPQRFPIFLSDVHQVVDRQNGRFQGRELCAEPCLQSGKRVNTAGRQLGKPFQSLPRQRSREDTAPDGVANRVEHHLMHENPHVIVWIGRVVVFVECRHFPLLRQRRLQNIRCKVGESRRGDRLTRWAASIVCSRALRHRVRRISP